MAGIGGTLSNMMDGIKNLLSEGWERGTNAETSNPMRTAIAAFAGIFLGMKTAGLTNGTGGLIVGGALGGMAAIMGDAIVGHPIEAKIRSMFGGGKADEAGQGQVQVQSQNQSQNQSQSHRHTLEQEQNQSHNVESIPVPSIFRDGVVPGQDMPVEQGSSIDDSSLLSPNGGNVHDTQSDRVQVRGKQ